MGVLPVFPTATPSDVFERGLNLTPKQKLTKFGIKQFAT
jgi:hypothetical protein